MVERTAKSYQVILLDYPGFGDTQRSAWITSISDLAYFYMDIIDVMDLGEIHLVGHSVDGWIATVMAVRNSATLEA